MLPLVATKARGRNHGREVEAGAKQQVELAAIPAEAQECGKALYAATGRHSYTPSDSASFLYLRPSSISWSLKHTLESAA
jgi:hypothetical protein